MVRYRVRIRFGKQGDLRWLGHRDLMRCCERWFRRAALPMAFSEGFHPKPRMTFPLALAVGIAAENEVLELDLAEPLSGTEIQRRLQRCAPQGLVLGSVESPVTGKAKVIGVEYCGLMPQSLVEVLPQRIAQFLDSDSSVVSRGPERTPVDVRPLVESLRLEGGRLHMRLAVGANGSAGPREVMSALGLPDAERDGAVWSRTDVILESGQSPKNAGHFADESHSLL